MGNHVETVERAGGLGLTLFGGGARAAYQVGVLRGLGLHHPDLAIPYVTGISAGAINAAFLADRGGSFAERAEGLTELWRGIDVDRVFEVQGVALLHRAFCILVRLVTGWAPTVDPLRGMVDTAPLRAFLEEALGGTSLDGIERNLEDGTLRAIALIALNYATGQTVTFFEGEQIADWERPLRRSLRTDLRLEHVLASSALPLFFPPIEIDDAWYGDGGIRLTAPLAPAIHLGADRLLAISTRYRPTGAEADRPRFSGEPRAAQIVGNLMSATFLDVLDQDAHNLERINRLVERLPPDQRMGLRKIKCLVIRPSRDIARLANEFEPRLPRTFRFLVRRWGTDRSRSQELLSTVLFQHDYVRLLLEIGEADGAAQSHALEELLAEDDVVTTPS